MNSISFPHVGNYYIPINILLSNITNKKIIIPKKITNNTIMLGNKYSPEFICTPFKYTLGNFIENAKKTDIMIQLGGGCKYGYYFELQQKILDDLNLNVEIINLVTKGKASIKELYKKYKKIGNENIFKVLYYLLLLKKMIFYMDDLENIIRKNSCNSNKNIDDIYNNFLHSIESEKNILNLRKKYKKCKKEMLDSIDINNKYIKIGIIGELYTMMEPFANHNIEKKLMNKGISITRETNATYLLFNKKKEMKKNIKKSKYIKSLMGADASDNIYRCEKYCKEGYDAILHIKSSFCTPEIGAMPIISKICNDYDVPVLFLSFDTNLSETGLITRLDALVDMLEMRKKNEGTLFRR